MGWNSYDMYGGQVTEAEVRANADYMALHLARHGWEYVVIDIAWHSGTRMGHFEREAMDGFGRLLPSPERFPSSRDGAGFKPLADYIHSLGLKFGIHVMPGIPRRAIELDCPILGAQSRAGDIADATRHNDLWPDGLPLVDMTRPGAQAYYDSLLALYASWGVDFIKADGVGAVYHPDQVAALDHARKACGRPIVLSLSAGCPDYVKWPEHRKAHCEMWRVSEDFWDRWPQVEAMFTNLRAWQDHGGPGHWLDADMLPLGRIGQRQHPDNAPDRMTRLTRDEQRTVMTLWCVAQSPLMFGGDLPSNDEWTLSLLTNDEVLAVNQQGRRARELSRDCAERGVVWTADMPDPGVKAVGVFNFDGASGHTVTIPLAEAGYHSAVRVRDLWAHQDLGPVECMLSVEVPPHGARLLRVAGEPLT